MRNLYFKHVPETIMSLVFSLLINSCNKNDFKEYYNYQENNISITGKSITEFSCKEASRNTYTNSIPDKSEISIFSNGGIELNNETLTLNGNKWDGIENYKWNNYYDNAELCVFYPKINNPENIKEYLYSEKGELNDILYCHENIKRTNIIELKFKHLFSKICFYVDSRINNRLKNINLNIPYKITKLNTSTGEFEYEQTDSNNLSAETNDNGIYEFIVPSDISMTVKFRLNYTDSDDIYNENIQETTFKKGVQYNIKIKKSQENGIYTTEDFIAFTNLINGYEYKNRKLFEFYNIEDGKKVYNLYSDLDFTKEECKQIKQIGIVNEKNANGFNDIFKGNGKTLNGLYFNTDEKVNYYSLFNTIGNEGIVEDLIINNISFDITTIHENMNFASMVGNNYGFINKCKIDNIKILGSCQNPIIGGMVFENNGTIINSNIKNISIEGDSFTIGVLNYINNKEILNCAIMTGPIKNSNSGKNSVICVYNNADVYNVFVKDVINLKYCSTSFHKDNGTFIYCIIPGQYYDAKDINTPQRRIIVYHYKRYEHYTQCIDFLNSWIKNYSKKKFPNYVFTEWKKMTKKEFDNYK